jgi:hypothetical protein
MWIPTRFALPVGVALGAALYVALGARQLHPPWDGYCDEFQFDPNYRIGDCPSGSERQRALMAVLNDKEREYWFFECMVRPVDSLPPECADQTFSQAMSIATEADRPRSDR